MVLGDCPECEAEIDELSALSCSDAGDVLDVVLHGCDTLSVDGAFGGDLLAALRCERGADDMAERQLACALSRGKPWREPAGYEDAWLPSANSLTAAKAATKKLNDAAFRQKRLSTPRVAKTCINGHDQLLYRRASPSGARWCLLCSRAASARRYRRNSSSIQQRAWSATKYAILNGTLIRQPCEVCGATTPTVHAHHDDYRKPLDVRWLCFRHHVRRHHSLFTRIKRARASIMRKARFEEKPMGKPCNP